MSGWRDWPEIWSCSWTGPYGMLWVVNLLLYLFPLLSFHGPRSHSVLPHVSLAADQRCGQKLCIQTCMTCDVIMEMNLEWKSGFFLRNFKGLIRFIMTRHVEALQRDQFPASSPHCVPYMQPFFPLSLSLYCTPSICISMCKVMPLVPKVSSSGDPSTQIQVGELHSVET